MPIQRPRPTYRLRDIHAITPAWLQAQGLKAVFLDLDNTLDGYKTALPSPRSAAWLTALPKAGFPVAILSNNREERVGFYCRPLDIPYVARAGKPQPDTLLAQAAAMGLAPAEVLMVGDQVRTDIRAANRAGMPCAWVEPVKNNAFYTVRRWIERLWAR